MAGNTLASCLVCDTCQGVYCKYVYRIALQNIPIKMYSQNDETGVLEVVENKIFFSAQPWWGDLYRIL